MLGKNKPLLKINLIMVTLKLISLIAGNGNRGVGGYFEIPPLAEKFWKIPPPPGDFGKNF